LLEPVDAPIALLNPAVLLRDLLFQVRAASVYSREPVISYPDSIA